MKPLPQDLHRVALSEADARGLPAQLVEAIIQVESGGDPFALRLEPGYRYLWNVASNSNFRSLTSADLNASKAPKDFPYLVRIESRDTEWWGQRSSWGLMQVMGAVAREYGFNGAFPMLCSPEQGVKYGVYHLGKLRDRFLKRYGWEGVAAAYNAGSPRRGDGGWVNQGYVNKIRKYGGLSFDTELSG